MPSTAGRPNTPLRSTVFRPTSALGQDIGDAELLYELAKPWLDRVVQGQCLNGEGCMGTALDANWISNSSEVQTLGLPAYRAGRWAGVFAAGCPERRDHTIHHQRAKTKFSAA